MDAQEAYIHVPLDDTKAQIRLLHVQPRLESEPDLISCSVGVGNLENENCKYEALSYEWGDEPNISFTIMVDGMRVDVRENLWWALWHIRFEQGVRVMWIDALCIDQENLKERNHQVSQMARIYKQATGVVAWLGRLEEEVSLSPASEDPHSSNATEAAEFSIT